MSLSLFDRPAVLFLPASNPRAIAKARASAADLVILDLEDAVKPEHKDTARSAAVAAIAEPWPMPVAIRVNAFDSAWFAQDISAVRASRADALVVPMVAFPAAVNAARENCAKPVLAMIESAAGVLAAPAIAREAAALIVGVNDLSADLRLPAIDRASIAYALQATLVAARAAGIAAFDGVFNRLDDPAGLAAEAAQARALGFDGKSLIHPDQIAPCHAAFAPSAEELERARRLIAAASGGAERFEGAMVEAMHVESAKRLLGRYG